WYQAQSRIIYVAYQNFACSLVGGALFLISTWFVVGIPHRALLPNVLLYANATAVGLLGGPLYRFIFMSALFVIRLSRHDLKIYVFNHPTSSVKTAGQLLFRYALFYATPAYLLCVLIARLANPRLTVTAALWVAAGAVIVLAYFFVPQYHLHRVMLHAKKTKLATTSFKIEEVLAGCGKIRFC